jgi:hypothetical protein
MKGNLRLEPLLFINLPMEFIARLVTSSVSEVFKSGDADFENGLILETLKKTALYTVFLF